MSHNLLFLAHAASQDLSIPDEVHQSLQWMTKLLPKAIPSVHLHMRQMMTNHCWTIFQRNAEKWQVEPITSLPFTNVWSLFSFNVLAIIPFKQPKLNFQYSIIQLGSYFHILFCCAGHSGQLNSTASSASSLVKPPFWRNTTDWRYGCWTRFRRVEYSSECSKPQLRTIANFKRYHLQRLRRTKTVFPWRKKEVQVQRCKLPFWESDQIRCASSRLHVSWNDGREKMWRLWTF